MCFVVYYHHSLATLDNQSESLKLSNLFSHIWIEKSLFNYIGFVHFVGFLHIPIFPRNPCWYLLVLN